MEYAYIQRTMLILCADCLLQQDKRLDGENETFIIVIGASFKINSSSQRRWILTTVFTHAYIALSIKYAGLLAFI